MKQISYLLHIHIPSIVLATRYNIWICQVIKFRNLYLIFQHFLSLKSLDLSSNRLNGKIKEGNKQITFSIGIFINLIKPSIR